MSDNAKSSKMPDWEEYLSDIEDRRVAGNVVTKNYKFDMTRCRFLSLCRKVKKPCNGIIYYMQRDCRVYDNWALTLAQILALKTKSWVYIVFSAKQQSMFPTLRQFKFALDGSNK